MSGIAAIFNTAGQPVAQEAIQAMLRAQAHRGPDALRTWLDGPVGLGHCRLDTTPESASETQPLANEAGTVHLIADARVDNREELQARLKDHGRVLRTPTDAELILRAYEAWGEQCPLRLLGDFAFAVWDARNREIFCARDPIGIKPIYYALQGTTFRCVSEPNALFADGSLPRRPNLKLIGLYFLNRFAEAEETLDIGVYCLPPAHWLRLRAGKLAKGRYWSPDPSHRITGASNADYAERFLSLFRESVRDRLRSRGSVGVLLSGGLDSSSIAGTAQALLREGVVPGVEFEAYSLSYGDLPCDERSHIDAVATHSGVRTHLVGRDQSPAWLNFDRWQDDPDIPYFPTILDFGPVLQAARARGVRVMLDGLGGDDLLAANLAHLTDLLLEGRFGRLLAQLRHDATKVGANSLSLFLQQCVRPLVPSRAKRLVRRLWRPQLPSWLNADCLRRSGALDWLESARPEVLFPGRSQQSTYEELVGGWNTRVALPALERFCARFAIEARHPFWDRRVVEFVLALPHEQRWQGPWSKVILRRAMQGILPESIRWRRDKAEFSGMIDDEFRSRQRVKIVELGRGSVLCDLGLVHERPWQHFLLNWLQEGTPAPSDRVTIEHFIWLELWCRATQNRCRRS